MMTDLRERIEAAQGRLGGSQCDWPDSCIESIELRELRAEAAREFGATRGWRLSRSPFSIRQLRTGSPRRTMDDRLMWLPRPLIDHPEYFRYPGRPYLPAAIVTHVNCGEAELRAAAAEAQLDCEVLPWSWYYPGNTVAAVLTAPAGAAGG